MKVTKSGLAASYVVFALCLNASVIFSLVGANNEAVLSLSHYILLAGAALLIVTIPHSTAKYLVNSTFLLLLYLWASASILWAPDPIRIVKVLATLWPLLLCGVVAAYFLDANGAITTIRRTIVALAVGSAIVQAVSPQRVGEIARLGAPGWTGIYGEKNHFGAGMAVGCIAILASPEPWNWKKVLQFGLCSVLLLGSQSATATGLVVVVGVIYLFLVTKPRARPLFALILVGAAVLGAVFIPNVVTYLFGAAGKSTTFTGRDVIWAFTWKYWKEKFWLGWGTFSFWEYHGDEALMEFGWNPSEAHNGFLEIGVTLGAIGLVLLVGALGSGVALIRRAFREGHTLAARWLLFSWVGLIIGNITEADFMVPGPLWFGYCIVYFVTYAEVSRGGTRRLQVRSPEEEVRPPQLQPAFALPGLAPGD